MEDLQPLPDQACLDASLLEPAPFDRSALPKRAPITSRLYIVHHEMGGRGQGEIQIGADQLTLPNILGALQPQLCPHSTSVLSSHLCRPRHFRSMYR
jgi:hypothetical protein